MEPEYFVGIILWSRPDHNMQQAGQVIDIGNQAWFFEAPAYVDFVPITDAFVVFTIDSRNRSRNTVLSMKPLDASAVDPDDAEKLRRFVQKRNEQHSRDTRIKMSSRRSNRKQDYCDKPPALDRYAPFIKYESRWVD